MTIYILFSFTAEYKAVETALGGEDDILISSLLFPQHISQNLHLLLSPFAAIAVLGKNREIKAQFVRIFLCNNSFFQYGEILFLAKTKKQSPSWSVPIPKQTAKRRFPPFLRALKINNPVIQAQVWNIQIMSMNPLFSSWYACCCRCWWERKNNKILIARTLFSLFFYYTGL